MKTAFDLYNEMQIHYRNYKLGIDRSGELGRIGACAVQLMTLEQANPFPIVSDSDPDKKHGELYQRVTGRSENGERDFH